jgi:ArsR family metal-binding transcriptional regulator
MAVVFQYGDREVTLFAHGRMLIKGVASEEEAIDVYRKVIDKVGTKRPGRYA